MLGVVETLSEPVGSRLARLRASWRVLAVGCWQVSGAVDCRRRISPSKVRSRRRSWIRSRVLWISDPGSSSLLDRADRVDHGRVVAVEAAGDLGEREVGLVARDVHRELAAADERRRCAAREVMSAGARCRTSQTARWIRSSCSSASGTWSGRRAARVGPIAAEGRADQVGGGRLAEHGGEGGDAGQRALEAAQVVGRGEGDLLERRRGRGAGSRARSRGGAAGRSGSPRSGPWSSTVRPQAKRSRIRSLSRPWPPAGGRWRARSGCRRSSSSLNVWKNSSSVRALPSRNWTSSISSASDLAVALLEALGAAAGAARTDRVDELGGEALGGRVDDGQVGPLAAQVVGDRDEQVGLAEAWRAVEEQRVVGLAGDSATASAAEWAKRLPEPITKRSKSSPRRRPAGIGSCRAAAPRPRAARRGVGEGDLGELRGATAKGLGRGGAVAALEPVPHALRPGDVEAAALDADRA